MDLRSHPFPAPARTLSVERSFGYLSPDTGDRPRASAMTQAHRITPRNMRLLLSLGYPLLTYPRSQQGESYREQGGPDEEPDHTPGQDPADDT